MFLASNRFQRVTEYFGKYFRGYVGQQHHLTCIAMAVGIAIFGVSCSGPDGSDGGGGSLDTPGVQAVAAQGWEAIKLNAYNYADTQLDSYGHFTTTPNGCHQDAQGAVNVALWNQVANLMNKALSKPLLTEDNEVCIARPDGSRLFGTVEVIVDPPTTSPHSGTFIVSSVTQPHPQPRPSFPWPFSSDLPDPSSSPVPTPSFSHPSPTPTISTNPVHSPTPGPSTSASPSPSPSPSGITKTLFENRGDQICSTIQDSATVQSLVQAFDQISAIAYKEDCPGAQPQPLR